MRTYKPGDKIAMTANSEGLPANYIIADIFIKGPCLINIDTGLQASAPIACKDKYNITEDEMNNTHGIGQFKWVYINVNVLGYGV